MQVEEEEAVNANDNLGHETYLGDDPGTGDDPGDHSRSDSRVEKRSPECRR